MRIDPALRALRSDPAPQRLAQEAVEGARDAWRAREEVVAAFEELRAYGEGAALDDCPALRALLEGHEAALRWLGPLFDGLIRSLAQHPFGQVPFRHQMSDGLGVLQLAASGRAALSLLTYEEARASETACSVCFADGERVEIVLAGGADLRIIEILEDGGDRAVLDFEPRRVVAGDRLQFDDCTRTKQVCDVHGSMVVLRLARSAATPRHSREFRLSDGALLHRASGDRNESRREMMMALLGRMGRRDAAPIFEAMTHEGSDHLRWQSLRECLALDTARGFSALGTIAANPNDSLAAPAGALRAQLLETYPQLSQLEDIVCPA